MTELLVVEFAPEEHNYVTIGEQSFFLLMTCNEGMRVCRDGCPHRGGPLHLGRMDCRTKSLTCPWHETVFTEQALSRRCVPSVKSGDKVTVIVPAEPGAPVHRVWKRIIANEHPQRV